MWTSLSSKGESNVCLGSTSSQRTPIVVVVSRPLVHNRGRPVRRGYAGMDTLDDRVPSHPEVCHPTRTEGRKHKRARERGPPRGKRCAPAQRVPHTPESERESGGGCAPHAGCFVGGGPTHAVSVPRPGIRSAAAKVRPKTQGWYTRKQRGKWCTPRKDTRPREGWSDTAQNPNHTVASVVSENLCSAGISHVERERGSDAAGLSARKQPEEREEGGSCQPPPSSPPRATVDRYTGRDNTRHAGGREEKRRETGDATRLATHPGKKSDEEEEEEEEEREP